MLFKQGIKVGAQGGHGPIKYEVELYDPQEIIQFRFSKPNGFHGIHKFEIQTLTKTTTEIKHTIDMQTTGKGTLLWLLGIRSLHNALVEDGFDKLENIFQKPQKITKWNFWVRFLRKLLARRSK
ncbi:hypothetical protein [Marinoscillum sp.]|uniref:hypothetical protein n=1 Tax=Marinoscillum sp. TaxID=2024838 RepID=UPI003BADB76F